MTTALRIIYLSLLQMLVCAILVANPDVFFVDSSAYDGAYLRHELEGNKIKFVLSREIPDISLPDQYFSLNKLVSYIDEEYVFTNPALKLEFVRMLRASIESKFTLKEFLTELNTILEGFNSHDRGRGKDGCSATSVNSHTFLLIGLAWLLVQRFSRMKNNARALSASEL